jgi:hypothetical protein
VERALVRDGAVDVARNEAFEKTGTFAERDALETQLDALLG